MWTTAFLSRRSRAIDPHLDLRRGKGALLDWYQEFQHCGAGKLGVPLKGDGYVGELFGLRQGCQIPFRISGGNLGFLLRRYSGNRPHLTMTEEPRGFSRVASGFSNFDQESKEPLVLPQGSPVTIRVARGSSALLSIHCRGIWPQDRLKGELCGLSQVVQVTLGFLDL